MIDNCSLSATWTEYSISSIGFVHPTQYLTLQRLDNVQGELTHEQKNLLLDPKTYAEKLEWLIASFVQKKPITIKYVLCFNNKPSDCKDEHTDIFLNNWEPLGEHLNLFMKPYPDDYGVDMIKVSINLKGIIQLYLSQIKLGGSRMSPGNLKKRDTVIHMISRLHNGAPKIVQFLQTRKLPTTTDIIVIKDAYITRQLSSNSRNLIQQAKIILYDRKEMIDDVWSVAVKTYANALTIKWITEIEENRKVKMIPEIQSEPIKSNTEDEDVNQSTKPKNKKKSKEDNTEPIITVTEDGDLNQNSLKRKKSNSTDSKKKNKKKMIEKDDNTKPIITVKEDEDVNQNSLKRKKSNSTDSKKEEKEIGQFIVKNLFFGSKSSIKATQSLQSRS